MIGFDPAKLWPLCPRALGIYVDSFADGERVMGKYGVLDNEKRRSHFLAQMAHETGGFTVLVENLNYSAERLMVVWPTRFRSLAEAKPFSHNPRGLANKVYGGRMGNTGPGDGWRYIGRGMLQLTGRYNYQRIGRMVGVDLVGDPNLVLLPEHALTIACAEWKHLGCNGLADTDDVRAVTKAINGGTIGLEQRRSWLSMIRRAYAPPSMDA